MSWRRPLDPPGTDSLSAEQERLVQELRGQLADMGFTAPMSQLTALTAPADSVAVTADALNSVAEDGITLSDDDIRTLTPTKIRVYPRIYAGRSVFKPTREAAVISDEKVRADFAAYYANLAGAGQSEVGAGEQPKSMDEYFQEYVQGLYQRNEDGAWTVIGQYGTVTAASRPGLGYEVPFKLVSVSPGVWLSVPAAVDFMIARMVASGMGISLMPAIREDGSPGFIQDRTYWNWCKTNNPERFYYEYGVDKGSEVPPPSKEYSLAPNGGETRAKELGGYHSYGLAIDVDPASLKFMETYGHYFGFIQLEAYQHHPGHFIHRSPEIYGYNATYGLIGVEPADIVECYSLGAPPRRPTNLKDGYGWGVAAYLESLKIAPVTIKKPDETKPLAGERHELYIAAIRALLIAQKATTNTTRAVGTDVSLQLAAASMLGVRLDIDRRQPPDTGASATQNAGNGGSGSGGGGRSPRGSTPYAGGAGTGLGPVRSRGPGAVAPDETLFNFQEGTWGDGYPV